MLKHLWAYPSFLVPSLIWEIHVVQELRVVPDSNKRRPYARVALQRAREHRQPVTPTSEEGDPRRLEPSRRMMFARRAMCATWRVCAPARIGRALENGSLRTIQACSPGTTEGGRSDSALVCS